MANKSGFITLIVIIAILTVSIAMLAGYIFVAGGTSQQQKEIVSNSVRRPSDRELGTKKLYDEDQYFVLKGGGSSKSSYIRVGVDLRYFVSVRGIKNCEEKINNFDSEIKELIGTYFQNVTIDEVKDSEFKIKAKEDLKAQINDLLNSSESIYNDIVYDVVFYDWFYQ